MKNRMSSATGHRWERRYSDHDKKLSNVEWDSEKKEWRKERRKYPYCTNYKQYRWGAMPMCPDNTETILVPQQVVKQI